MVTQFSVFKHEVFQHHPTPPPPQVAMSWGVYTGQIWADLKDSDSEAVYFGGVSSCVIINL